MRFQSLPLNSGGSGRPLFFLPPHGAGGLEYHAFRHFFEAVRAPIFGFDAVYTSRDRLDDWASGLAEEILQVTGSGVCDLLGWGHGAVLAALLADRLPNARVLLFDPVPPDGYSRWERLKGWLRLRLVGLPAVAVEFTRWLRGSCSWPHLREFAAHQLAHGYWLPPQLQARQRTRHQLSAAEIYSARAAFRNGTACYVPRKYQQETHLLLSRNRLRRRHQWQPYLAGPAGQWPLERNSHDFSPLGLEPLARCLNQLPQ